LTSEKSGDTQPTQKPRQIEIETAAEVETKIAVPEEEETKETGEAKAKDTAEDSKLSSNLEPSTQSEQNAQPDSTPTAEAASDSTTITSTDSAETTTTEPAPEYPLDKARTLLEQGQLEKCREVLKHYWLDNTFDRDTVALYVELTKEMGKLDVSEKLANLHEKLGESLAPYKHHQEIFEAGWALVEIRQHELAAMLLKELYKELPDDPQVNYELGFALMSSRKFKEAKRHFAQVANGGPDFDAVLNLCVCETLDRNTEGAKRLIQELESLVSEEEEKLELEHRKVVLHRLETLNHKKVLTLRDWFYILYGSVLLRPNIKPEFLKEDISKVASTMVVLHGFLEGMSCEVEAMEYYSLKTKPMVSALAQSTNVPFDAYKGPNRPDSALLLMCWTTDILGPHQVFIENAPNRHLFAYALNPDEPLPIVPDIIGCLAEDLRMPWEGKEISVREQEKVVAQIMDRFATLQSQPELVNEAQEAVAYYSDKRAWLVFQNSENLKQRPEYTAELPLSLK
jgi:tetratricopeptide (TPR) repeat protein